MRTRAVVYVLLVCQTVGHTIFRGDVDPAMRRVPAPSDMWHSYRNDDILFSQGPTCETALSGPRYGAFLRISFIPGVQGRFIDKRTARMIRKCPCTGIFVFVWSCSDNRIATIRVPARACTKVRSDTSLPSSFLI